MSTYRRAILSLILIALLVTPVASARPLSDIEVPDILGQISAFFDGLADLVFEALGDGDDGDDDELLGAIDPDGLVADDPKAPTTSGLVGAIDSDG